MKTIRLVFMHYDGLPFTVQCEPTDNKEAR